MLNSAKYTPVQLSYHDRDGPLIVALTLLGPRYLRQDKGILPLNNQYVH